MFKRILLAVALLALTIPATAATYTQLITASLGSANAGLGTNVGYTVYDNAGTAQITRTTSGITEINDNAGNGAGTYSASITVTTSWLPIRVHWDVAGKAGLIADAIIGSERSAEVGDGYTGTLATNVGTTNTRVTTALPNAAPAASGGLPTVGSGSGQLNPASGTFTGVTLTTAEHTSIQTDAATGLLVTPSNKISTNGSNQVVASSVQGNVTGSVASVTGAVASVTGAVGSVTGAVGSVTGAVGSVTAGVTVATNNDKTGYALTSGEHTNIAADSLNATAASYNSAGTIGQKINAAGTSADPWSTNLSAGGYTANQAGAIVYNNLNAAVSTRLPTSSYSAAPTTSQVASAILLTPSNLLATDSSNRVTVGTNADKTGYALTSPEHTAISADVWNATATSYNTSGTTGQKINAAGSAGNPWTTDISTGYSGNQAGFIVFNDLNATVSSRAPSGNVTVGGYASGQDPATLILTTPANKLASTSGGGVTVGAYAAGQDPATLILAATADGTVTLKQVQALSLSVLAGKYSVSRNSTTGIQTTTYYRQDGTTVLATSTATPDNTGRASTRTWAFSNLP